MVRTLTSRCFETDRSKPLFPSVEEEARTFTFGDMRSLLEFTGTRLSAVNVNDLKKRLDSITSSSDVFFAAFQPSSTVSSSSALARVQQALNLSLVDQQLEIRQLEAIVAAERLLVCFEFSS